MADKDASQDDKQLPATERRLKKAAEEGQVARSRDVTHAALAVAALMGFQMLGSSIGNNSLALVRNGLRISPAQFHDPTWMARRLGDLAGAALQLVFPFLILMAVVLAVAAIVPGGMVFTSKPITPDLNRLNPQSGFSRLLSKDSAINMVKLIGIAAALALASWLLIGGSLERFAKFAELPLPAALMEGLGMLGTGLAVLAAVLLAVAFIDVPLQLYRHHTRLKMTHQELREEIKETDGDPHLRARIRQRQREIGRVRMLSAVQTADVVITNPTHYAVAIRYEEMRMGAPRVVAKGVDHMAQQIRTIAREHGVTQVELPPLARALYAHVEVDREIPGALYSAVAQVLAYVYQLRHFVPGRGRMPQPPTEVEVPAELDPQHGPAAGAAAAASVAGNDGTATPPGAGR